MDYSQIAKSLAQEFDRKTDGPLRPSLATVGVKIKAAEMLINVIQNKDLFTLMLLNGPEDGLTILKHDALTGVTSVEGLNLDSIKGLINVMQEYLKHRAEQRAAVEAQQRALEQQAVQQYQQKQQPGALPQAQAPANQPSRGAVTQPQPVFQPPGSQR